MDNEIIYAYQYKADISKMDLYSKRNFNLGYVRGTDVVEAGTKATIRTMEGDVDVDIAEDTIIMIGIRGEIYPTTLSAFEKGYESIEGAYEYPGEYQPSVRNIESGVSVQILPYAKRCKSTGKSKIYAKELTGRTKIFTRWDPENYYLGKPGDYVAVPEQDASDVYIIERDIFNKTYERI